MPEPPASAVEARDLTFGYGARRVLEGVSLRVPPGGCLALLGPSGSGKTTLLRLLAGLLPPGSGEVVLRLPHAAPARAHREAGRVGYIPQHLGLVRSRRVLDNVLAGALARVPEVASLAGDFPEAEVEAAQDALRDVGLAGREGERVHSLSGGERQRVAVARALVQRPPLLCADEFVSNLDVVNADRVLALVDRLRASGTTVVMALHDVELARAHAEDAAVLRGGRLVREGPARALALDEMRGLLGA